MNICVSLTVAGAKEVGNVLESCFRGFSPRINRTSKCRHLLLYKIMALTTSTGMYNFLNFLSDVKHVMFFLCKKRITTPRDNMKQGHGGVIFESN